MIKLLKFGANFGVPDPSTFVLKLETYLRLAEIEYHPQKGDVRKAPKGKFPVLVDGDTTIADSHFAIQHLKEKFGDKLNEGRDDTELAHHHMLRLALENHTYFMMLAYRWLRDENAPLMHDAFFSELGMMSKLVFKMVQRGMRRTVHGQGILRHSWDEIDRLIKEDITHLDSLLATRPYFGGQTPGEIDCTTFAFIANMIVPEIPTPFLELSRQSSRLVDYHNRMTDLVFPDYKSSMHYSS